MSRRFATYSIVMTFFLAGSAAVTIRKASRQASPLGRGDRVWRLTYEIQCSTVEGGIRLHVALPSDMPKSRVFRRAVSHPGVSAGLTKSKKSGTQQLTATLQGAGTYEISGEFDIHVRPWNGAGATANLETLSAEDRAHYLRAEKSIQTDSPEVSRVLEELGVDRYPKSSFLSEIFKFCSKRIATMSESSFDVGATDAAYVLGSGKGTPLGACRAMVALCRKSRLPARLITGFELKHEGEALPRTWAEVYLDQEWLPYDPVNGYEKELPASFVAARKDGSDIAWATAGTARLSASYWLLSPLKVPPGFAGQETSTWLKIFDLRRLAISIQETLSLLLILPFGALITCVFRNFIGLNTFGTFTPALLSLSFIYADWATGLFLLGFVLLLGLSSRVILDRLRLLRVPRLSVVLTLVVLCVIFSVSAMEFYGVTTTTQAVILPLVIVTMLVERAFVSLEEDGLRMTMQLATGTLTMALLCFLLLRWRALGELLVAYPEIHFFTLGALIAVGRYTGYRLTELWRFRDLVRQWNRGVAK